MERLTQKFTDGTAFYDAENAVYNVGIQGINDPTFVGTIVSRLAEYEDLGLTPEQIKEIDRMYTEKCKRISYMSRHITEKLDDAKPPYNRIPDSLEENRMQVGQISGLNKAIEIVRECMENMDREVYSDVWELEFLRNSAAIGCRCGLCRCGTPVISIHKYCHECGVKLAWEGVRG